MRFESYAQFLEDLVLYCALKNVEADGFYIDVGANDPTHDSVTKFFYDRGWRGINIEPLPDKCKLLAELRPRDINLCVGLGSKRGKLNFYMEDMMSTFSSETVDFRSMDSRPQRQKNVLTLSEVYERYCAPQQEIHFCKIDVEGYEKEVLEGVSDWQKFRPCIFAVESTLPGTGIPCHDKWENILLENDYFFAAQFGINRYYIDIEKEYLLEGFNSISQFIAQNEIVVLRMQKVEFN